MLGVRQILPASIQHAGDTEPGPQDGSHVVATKNRWSRLILLFRDLTPDVWCEFSFEIEYQADETASNISDYAAIGIDFQADDGSSIDFAFVPGLVKGQIDPYHYFVSGPGSDTETTRPGQTRTIKSSFLVPAPATQAQVTIRSWRNAKPFIIKGPALVQFAQPGGESGSPEDTLVPSRAESNASLDARRNWPVLSSRPHWFRYGLVQGHNLFVRGQVITDDTSSEGALVRVVYHDEHGIEIPPPYPETLTAPNIGAFIGIPTRSRARRFTLELTAPPNATAVELGFCTRNDSSRMELVLPLEISLGYDLLLENIEDEAAAESTDFIDAAARRLKVDFTGHVASALTGHISQWSEAVGAAPAGILSRLRSLQQRPSDRVVSEHLHIEGFPAWKLPASLSWDEDPFGSPAWRMKYQSLTWLLDIESSDVTEALNRSIEFALSWSQANSWSSTRDELTLDPSVTAQRTEVLLELLHRRATSARKLDPVQMRELLGEAIRHGFALAEIIGQNTYSHSLSHIHAAISLLDAARALFRFPLARYWTFLAASKLREGFDELMGPNGEFSVHSPHERLELVSLGALLVAITTDTPEITSFSQYLAPRLKEAVRQLITLTDPGGVLPPFGDTPFSLRHASWIRKLLSGYGKTWMQDKGIRMELSYPQGARAFVSPSSGLIAARFYEQGRCWGYFCANLSEQSSFHGHSDSTSFVFASGSRRWITEASGSLTNQSGISRQYLASPQAHNIAVPNRRTPSSGTSWLKSHSRVAGAHIYEIGSNVHGPSFIHRRIFVVLENLGALAVFDHFIGSQGSTSFEAFLHFEPETMVSIANSQLAIGFQSRQKLRIVPLGITGRSDGLEVVHGRSGSSHQQGFISRGLGPLQTTNVLRYGFSGGRYVCGGILMALDETSYKTLMDAVRSPAGAKLLDPSP
jgi:Heparinase II/III-like protein.